MAKIVAGCKYCGHFFKIEEVFEGVELQCPRCKQVIEIKKMAGVDEKGLPTFEPALDEVLDRIFKGEGTQEDMERLQRLGGAFKSRTVKITKEELEAQMAQKEAPIEEPAPPAAALPEEPTRPHPVTDRIKKRTSRKISRRAVPVASPAPVTQKPPAAQPPYAVAEAVPRPILKYALIGGAVVAVLVVVLLWWRSMVRWEEEQKAADAVEEAYNKHQFEFVLLRAEKFLADFPDSELADRVREFARRAKKAKAVKEEMQRIEDALKDGDVEDAVRRMNRLDAGGTPFEAAVALLRQKVKRAQEEAEDNRLLDEIESVIREKKWSLARKRLLLFVPRTKRTRARYERLRKKVAKFNKEAQELLTEALDKRQAGDYREALRLVNTILEDYSESVVAEDARQLLPELKEDMFWMLRREGRRHMAAGRWRDAIRAFKEALIYKPNDPEIKSLLEQAEEKARSNQ